MIVRIFDIVLFFLFFFFRFTGLIATIRSNRGNETKRFGFCISY